jgi:hypothetical protein
MFTLTDFLDLLEATGAGHAAEAFIERNDLANSRLERNFSNQVIGKSGRAFAGSLQGSPGNQWRFDGHATGLKKGFDCMENSLSLPLAAENPGQLRQDKKRNENPRRRTGFYKGRASLPGLGRIIVEIGSSPYVGISYEHYHCLLALAASISSNVITLPFRLTSVAPTTPNARDVISVRTARLR